jgi:lysozyme family protein
MKIRIIKDVNSNDKPRILYATAGQELKVNNIRVDGMLIIAGTLNGVFTVDKDSSSIQFLSNFDKAFAHRITIEGGWDNKDTTDDGNYTGGKQGVGECIGTTWGVTAPELGKYLGRTATLQDMQNLSQETAAVIFKANYWDKFQGDRLNDYGIAQDLCDAAINQGLGTGIREIQEAAGLNVTGEMDENTIAHLNNQA